MGLYHVVITTLKTSSKKLTIILVELQRLPEKETTDPGEKNFGLNYTKNNGRCVNFKTTTE